MVRSKSFSLITLVLVLIGLCGFFARKGAAETTSQNVPTSESNNLDIVALGTINGTDIYQATIEGSYTYLLDGGTLRVISIANLSAPIQVGEITFSNTESPTFNNLLVDTTSDILYLTNGKSIYIVDVSSPSSPQLLTIFKSPSNEEALLTAYAHDRILYLPYYQTGSGGHVPRPRGIESYDVSSPATPILLDSEPTPYHIVSGRPPQHIFQTPEAIQKVGNLLYIRTHQSVWVLDVSDSLALDGLSFTRTWLSGSSHTVINSKLFVMNDVSDLFNAFEISATGTPVTPPGATWTDCEATNESDGCATASLIQFDSSADYLWMLTSEGLRAYDVLNPSLPTRVATNSSLTGNNIVVNDDLVLIFDRDDGDAIVAKLQSTQNPTSVTAGVAQINDQSMLPWYMLLFTMFAGTSLFLVRKVN